ncbi:tagaturonate reductase [Pleomorphovibrio marinus]|uniref:tagaturonate reductase n=1 Tax=Pleomorphovibrio marinus TaxID=2164132 RepID=UPI000E0A9865|nr:tagaturonate reductase [Pleomorphovibrio marinus]
METLSREDLQHRQKRPIKVLQFGTGNFLRGFADWMIDVMNEKGLFNGDIQMIQVHGKTPPTQIERQGGLYHLLTRGFKNGKTVDEIRLISSVQGATNPYLDFQGFLELGKLPEVEWIISNTTEAGIYFEGKDKSPEVTPESFPGKLAAMLYTRYRFFEGDPDKGLHVLPCELIEENGDKLKEITLRYAKHWELETTFSDWVEKNVKFYNTLVDRIVPGFPQKDADAIFEKTGFEDQLIVMAEPFHFWAIEAPESLGEKFPAHKLDLDVLFVKDLLPYRTRKVRILNGGHTAMVPLAYLRGLRLVKEAVEDSYMQQFLMEAIHEEIIPALDLPQKELKKFADDVVERFRNPFIDHQLSAIALNSISKFKVRVLPSMLDYIKKKEEMPKRLVQSMAALLVFYKGNYKGETLPLKDDAVIINYFDKLWKAKDTEEAVLDAMGKITFWDQDLTLVPGLSKAVTKEVKLLLKEEE